LIHEQKNNSKLTSNNIGTVMDAVEIGRIEEEDSGGATVPAVLQYHTGTVHG
jgi:hypothetical protein